MQVACKSLGFTTGAQMLVGESSPFTAPADSASLIREIVCAGTEMSLDECDIENREYEGFDYGEDIITTPVAVVCTTTSGTFVANSELNPQCHL